MNNIKIICDTMSDLQPGIAEKYDIDILPANIIFNEKEYKAGIDLTTEEFYKMLRSSKEIPKTSQIPILTFVDTFEKYINEGKTILYLAGSSAASGIYQTAMLVKNQIEGPLYIFDTYSLSVGSGMLVEKAAIMANEGKSVDEIISKLEEVKANSHVYFSVDSLEYLHKGGRISSTKAAVGTLLNIKPILTIEDGLVKQKSQVRGSKKLIPSLIQMQINDIGYDFSNIDIYVGHNDDTELKDAFVQKIKEELNPRNIYTVQIGACVACHSGPDIMGLACICE